VVVIEIPATLWGQAMDESHSGIGRRTLLAGAAAATLVVTIDQFTAKPAMAAYANGQLPASALTWVTGSSGAVPLEKACATAWMSMTDACRRALGLSMVVTSPDGGYRDLEMQQALVDDPQGPVPVASVGRSSHGLGNAIDIWVRDMDWMRANAETFGFTQTWSSEPWHWQWHGMAADAEYEGEISPDKKEEDEMATFIASNAAGTWFVTNGLTKRPLAPGENQLLVDLGLVKWPDGSVGNVKIISQASLDRIPNEV
jgi:hypothetical protein